MDIDTIYLHLTRKFAPFAEKMEPEKQTELDGILWALASGQDKQLRVVSRPRSCVVTEVDREQKSITVESK